MYILVSENRDVFSVFVSFVQVDAKSFNRSSLKLVSWAFALILNVSIPFNRKKRTLHFVYFKFVPFSFIGKKDFLLLPWATALSPPNMPPPPNFLSQYNIAVLLVRVIFIWAARAPAPINCQGARQSGWAIRTKRTLASISASSHVI